MSKILEFPEIHYNLLCHSCEGDLWEVMWPRHDEENWYVKCGNCGSIFNHKIIAKGLDKLEAINAQS